MRIYKVKANGAVGVKHIDATKEAMEREVGGEFQKIRLMPDKEIVCICRKSGFSAKLPTNILLPELMGDVFFAAAQGKKFYSLTDGQLNRVKAFFGRRSIWKR